jgi:hypothetical protein
VIRLELPPLRFVVFRFGWDSQIRRTVRTLRRESDGGGTWRELTARICVTV